MGKMIIAIDIEMGTRNFVSDFEWQGGENEIRNVINFIDRMADNAGISGEAFTHSKLRYLSITGWHSDPNEQEAQKLAVLYTVLQWPMRTPDRGTIRNHAASEDIEAVVTVRDASVTVQLKGELVGREQ